MTKTSSLGRRMRGLGRAAVANIATRSGLKTNHRVEHSMASRRDVEDSMASSKAADKVDNNRADNKAARVKAKRRKAKVQLHLRSN